MSKAGLKRADGLVEPGAVLAGRYKVVGEIGRGGMGIVYRVEHVHTGEPLALKVLVGAARSDPQALKRFKREARTSARIQSEHVVRVIDADRSSELDDSPFLVMELLHGMDVGRYATQRGALAPAEVVALLAQVASVLEAAHALGIVHRDLKPENLFLHQRQDGTTIAKVLDFGISKFVIEEQALETVGVTTNGVVIGTPLYMAPEQAHGQNDKIAPTTDVWAIGLIAMRLLTGEHYWGAPTMADLMMKIAVLPILPPSQRWPESQRMSPALDAWFLRSCDREQGKRWPTVGVQIAELASALGVALPSAVTSALTLDIAGPAPTPTSASLGGRWPRSRQLVLGLAASVACAAAIVLAGRGSSQTAAPSIATHDSETSPPPSAASAVASVAPAAPVAPVAPAEVSAVSSNAPSRASSRPPRAVTDPKPRGPAPSASAPLYAPLAP